MAKRRNFAERECPKCGGNIGVIRRDLSMPKRYRMDMLGCVSNTHIQVDGTWGYHVTDFPRRQK